MTGRIVKGISGFYYVYVAGSGIYECRARGVFRQKKMKPLVGDTVEIDVLSEADREGNLKRILPRKSELIRPAVANVDQALVIFACRDPEPNFQLLDRFLVMMEMQDIPVLICFNKRDLASEEEQKSIREIYTSAGYPVFFTSALDSREVETLREALRGKTTTDDLRDRSLRLGKIVPGQSALKRERDGDGGDQREDPPGKAYHEAQ